jgi:hypothetical protein
MADMLGEAMNVKNLSKVLFNPQAIAQAQQQMRMAQMQQQQQPGMAQPGGPPPAAGIQIPGGAGPMNNGLGQPAPGNPVFNTNRVGQGKPVSPRHNGGGMSPLPTHGMPQTHSIGA